MKTKYSSVPALLKKLSSKSRGMLLQYVKPYLGTKETVHLCLSLEIPLHPPQLPFSPFCYLTQSHLSITPLSPSGICSSLIMNPTGVLFIRRAGEERLVSQADPATLSSLGIWHRNFNRKATQAGRSVQETHCACQSELTNRREHSECAALLA